MDVGLTGGVTVAVWNIGSFKTMVFFYQTWQCHMPEDCSFDIYCCSSLSLHIELTSNAVRLTVLFILVP